MASLEQEGCVIPQFLTLRPYIICISIINQDHNRRAILGKGSVGPSTEDIVKDKEDENESIVKKDAEKEKDESHDENEKESISNNEELPKAWTNVKDHPIDNIIGDISKGVTTRFKISNLCHLFVFFCFTS